MMAPPQTRFVLASPAIIVATGLADWAFLSSETPVKAFLDVAMTGGSATAAIQPLMLS